jgi:hypothetical protein
MLRVKRDTRGFDLRVGDPGALERLQSELAEIDPQIARSRPLAASPLGLPILHAFWHQWHKVSSLNFSWLGLHLGGGGGGRAGLAVRRRSSFLQIQHFTPILP